MRKIITSAFPNGGIVSQLAHNKQIHIFLAEQRLTLARRLKRLRKHAHDWS